MTLIAWATLESGLLDAGYLRDNFLVGFGIALDAVIVTVLRARQLRRGRVLRDSLEWATAVGLTHWLFPMVGFMAGWVLARGRIASAIVYGIGALVMAGFVWQLLKVASREKKEDDEKPSSDWEQELEAPAAPGSLWRQGTFWLLVLAVSIDALISGPGKTVVTRGWTSEQVWVSFGIVGVVVFGFVLLSAIPAARIRRHFDETPPKNLPPDELKKQITTWTWKLSIATWAEISIFTYFACRGAK